MTLQNAVNGSGIVLQEVRSIVTSRVTCTTAMPFDDTIPQITEGDQVLTLTITPNYANSVIEIKTNFSSSPTAASNINAALFRNSDANAIAAAFTTPTGSGYGDCLSLSFYQTSGTTSPITYSLRVGPLNGTYTVYVNGTATGRMFGGVCTAYLSATEYLS